MTHRSMTPEEISEAFQAVRDNAAVSVHPLLNGLEELLLLERADRGYMSVKAGLAELNIVLGELGEPPTCLEELERADIDLARDIARGK